MTISTIEYALMAAAAYQSTRSQKNRISGPEGWGVIDLNPEPDLESSVGELSGFEATVFTRGSGANEEIVISFAGTYPNPDFLSSIDGRADIAIGAGLLDDQVILAALLYEQVKRDHPNAQISFTGHSLGGGLASLMAVFFNKDAYTFDQAPFRLAATEANAQALKERLALHGYIDDDLDSFSTKFILDDSRGFILPRGESRVRQTSVEGEALYWLNYLTPTERIGYESKHEYLSHGDNSLLDAVTLHSDALLIALKHCSGLGDACKALPFLISDLFNRDTLFAAATDSTDERDLLTHLIRYEFGVAGIEGSKKGLLTKFAADAELIAGFASADQDVKQGLMQLAMQSYHNTVTSDGKQFFEAMDDGIRFDLSGNIGDSAIAPDELEGYEALKTWILGRITGDEATATVTSHLAEGRRMTLVLGAGGGADALADNTSDFMMIAASGGWLNGKGGDDMLVGGNGMDALEGGTGNDTLIGGNGIDTYLYRIGDGNDKIIDSDKKGRIFVSTADGKNWYDTTLLTKDKDNPSQYRSADGQITLSTDGNWILNIGGGSIDLGTGCQDGDFGIHLKDAQSQTQQTNTIVGDQNNDKNDNLGGTENADLIKGLTGNDNLFGSSGDDRLQGGDGRDMLWGDAGDDILEGQAEGDILRGREGKDRMYGDVEINLAQAIANGRTDSGTGQQGDWLNGQNGDDIVVGTNDNDALFGGKGDDVLVGGAGDDTLDGDDDYSATSFDWSVTRYASTPFNLGWSPLVIADDNVTAPGGRDVLYAGNGDDFLFGGRNDDTLYGEDGSDSLVGAEDDDTLFGGDGNDKLTGDWGKVLTNMGDIARQGKDYLDGGAGDDFLQGEGSDDILYGGKGADNLLGDAEHLVGEAHGTDLLDGEEGDDQLWGMGGGDVLIGGEDNDYLQGDYDTSILAEAFHGNDILDGGAGEDTLVGDGGNDILDGGTENDQLDGGKGTDTLYGGEGNDGLSGGEGNDTLVGGAGTDTMEGGGGDDRFELAAGEGQLSAEGAAEGISDSGGIDTVAIGGGINSVTQNPGSDDVVIGYGSDDWVVITGGAKGDIEYFEVGGEILTYEQLVGRYSADSVTGTDSSGFDHLAGGYGDDTLSDTSLAGDAVLSGGEGSDTLIGGAGANTYRYGQGDGADIIVDGSAGNTLKLGDGLTASSMAVSQSVALDGKRYLDLDFGYGDVLSIRDGETGTLGQIEFADGTTLTNAELLSRLSSLDLIGTDGADTLQGTAGTDALRGLAGNDTLQGGDGADVLEGGAGDDTVMGEAGDDRLLGGAGNDTLIGGTGADTYRFGLGMGHDTVTDNVGEISVIELGEGVAVAALAHTRQGDDLYLTFRDGSGSLLLTNYYLDGQNWQVRSPDGSVQSMADLLVAVDAGPASVAEVLAGYKATVLGAWQARWYQDGDTVGSDGSVTSTARLISGNTEYSSKSTYRTVFDELGTTGGNFSEWVSDTESWTTTTTVQPALQSSSRTKTSIGAPGASGSPSAVYIPANGNPGGSMSGDYYNSSPLYVSDDNGDITGAWYFPQGSSSWSGSSVPTTVTLTRIDSVFDKVIHVPVVTGGVGDEWISIFGRGVLDGGAGNDVLAASAEPYMETVIDPLNNREVPGAFLFGNDGNDFLDGSAADDTLIGGRGYDSLDGRFGADTYRILDEDWADCIYDSGDDAARYQQTYYQSLGIEDVELSRAFGDKWVLVGDGVNGFDTYEAAFSYLQGEGWSSAEIEGLKRDGYFKYVPPLPDLASVSATDFGAIDALVATGAIRADRIVFGPGVTAANITVSGDAEHNFIILTQADGTCVYINGALADDPVGKGIERVEFADGTSLSMAELVARANVDHDLTGGDGEDSFLTGAGTDLLRGGAGMDSLWSGGGNDTITGGADADDLNGGNGADTYRYEGGDGADTLFDDGNDQARFEDWYWQSQGIQNIDERKAHGGRWIVTEGNQVVAFGSQLMAERWAEFRGMDVQALVTSGDLRYVEPLPPVPVVAANDFAAVEALIDAGVVQTDRIVLPEGVTESNLTIMGSVDEGQLILLMADGTRVDAGIARGDDLLGTGIERIVLADGTELSTLDIVAKMRQNHNVLGTTGDDYLAFDGGDDTADGGAGADVLSGGAGNDTLNGGADGDILIGGIGDDTYIVDASGDEVTEYLDEGVDSVQSSISYSLTENVENLSLTGTTAIDGNGNALDNVLAGNSASNTLTGGAGDDTVDGGAGADRLIGGLGNDTYIVDNIGDIITENAGEGTDLVQSSVTYTLSGNVENLTLTGTTAISGTGNALDNILKGNSGANSLTGGTGDDALDGGTGNDNLYGGTGSDTYLFGKGDGQDTVYSTNDAAVDKLDTLQFKSGVLASEVTLGTSATSLVVKIAGTTDQLTVRDFLYQDNPGNAMNPLQQIKFDDGTTWSLTDITTRLLAGTVGADAINGTFEADVIGGQGGNDTLYGRGGNDALNGGDDNDSIFGEDGDDHLDGGNGTDSLYGGNGNDVLDGGVGNDTLNGLAGSDTYLFGRGGGQDTISNYDAGTNKTDVLQFAADVAPGDIVMTRSGDNLTLAIGGTTDKVTVSNYFNSDGASAYKLEEIRFADSTVWDVTTVKELATVGTAGADMLTGYATADTLYGLSGNDTLSGRDGNDTLGGGAGTDVLYGNAGDDILLGGADADNLLGDTGNDTLDGGTGNDNLYCGTGSDTYLFGRGDGQDTVYSTNDAAVGKLDTLQFKAGVLASEVTLGTNGTSLVVKIAGTTDQLTVRDFLYQDNPGNAMNPLQQIRFDDGTTWSLTDIMTKLLAGTVGADAINGTLDADVICGQGGNDTLYGRGGNDTLDGAAGADGLHGDAGDDVLRGGADLDNLFGDAGNDCLDGGAGNDYLYGGAGNDTYVFERGHGVDTLSDNDATAGNTDIASFLSGIATDQIWFRHVGTALEVSVIGTSDRVTINNWYSGNQYHVEQFKTADGLTLLDSQVENLVQAMAAFSPPAAGQTTLPPTYQDALGTTIAANWQ